MLTLSSPCRLSGRVKKRALSSFDRDKLMSHLSAQLDYAVSYNYNNNFQVCILVLGDSI